MVESFLLKEEMMTLYLIVSTEEMLVILLTETSLSLIAWVVLPRASMYKGMDITAMLTR